MPKRSLRPTMRDVARLAGVSPMTVSRVQAGSALVAPETRDRINAAIAALGYVEDKVAASLSSRRTGFIATIVPTLTNSTFADTAHGLTEALRRSGYQLLIGYTRYRMSDEESLIRTMLERRPEAIVLAGMSHTEAAGTMLRGAGIPVVEIWDCGEADPIGYAVGFSNIESGRAAARHLIALGHRRIGAIGPTIGDDAHDFRGEARLTGFTEVLREAGLSTDRIVQRGDVPLSFAGGAAAMAHLLDTAGPLDAVFAISDLAAFGALMECQRRGIAVPGSLSVLGFGDFEIGDQCVPALSTIGIDAEDIGRRVGELLLRLLPGDAGDHGPTPTAVTDVGFKIVERGSTAPRPVST
ncbi:MULTISPECIES: LacI family DNA-binding transcriptional regulator [Inquilinus]|uniref:LacI family gluconate utilization system Gnt-I transcriptional repressor n=1 Tax=Inquilinus ginsengisoli TaxID=363840 RepID=A0ABU1JZ58_9PROT|nr:LacI family DNA-binding transcriptional regulator [Inquilinus ginsengisoli]MDR6293904.1 LacI family gluconate utilization system Gnt-I transcriptional repressor [Inquilinus ginsengisoli]